MQPIYLSLGYSADRFLSSTQPLNALEESVAKHLQGIAESLTTPEGYLTEVSAYLRWHNIEYTPLALIQAILNQRHEDN